MQPWTLITFLLSYLSWVLRASGSYHGVGYYVRNHIMNPIGLLGCIVRQQPSYPLGEELGRHTPLAWPELAGPVLSDEFSTATLPLAPLPHRLFRPRASTLQLVQNEAISTYSKFGRFQLKVQAFHFIFLFTICK